MSTLDKQEPIAIVGAACRFAGEASSLGSLWDMISKVKTGHCAVPNDRWDSKSWYHPDPDRKGGITPQHGYFIQQDISQFDAPFFSITAKEAAAMDPMKRLLLEVSYESIENAGIIVEDLMNSRTGCYVGCMTNDYEMISLHDIYNIGHNAASATSEAMTANRVSWFFGLKGPSLTLDTACSSSLYALHLACQSLRLRETNMSLVAGVNLMINPNTMHQLGAMHMLSPEGISHTFDDRCNGYGRGDGIGALIVKRLSDAIRDGDTIRAVIRGTGANADGKTPSITQPSSISQAELINQTYEDAGLDKSETGYCESHGTGTPVGDPLELTAIAATLGAARRDAGKTPLYVGSIKPTVGHTEGCAGLAGVFKSILLLEKGMLVPTYGVERVNPKLKLEEWNLALPQDVTKWPAPGMRRISVNSFGFGGANAHVILDDAYHYLQERNLSGRHNTVIHRVDDSGLPGSPIEELVFNPLKQLFLFSGKDQSGTKRVSETMSNWLNQDLKQRSGASLVESLAYTLGKRRTHLEHRSFAIASSQAELQEKLSKGLPAAVRSQRHGENLVMVFTGQGAQWPAMGRELFENATFRRSLETSQSFLKSLGCKWNALEELSKTPNPNVDRPEFSQPLCTVIQVALVDLLRSWNILPTATIGHSSGEIAAAYAASLVTHHDAIKLAYVRGISSAAVSKKGAMMAAGLSQEDAQSYLDKVPEGSAVVACINSPSSVTLSGDVEAIDKLEAMVSGDGKFARKLKVTTAYHSPHMREISPSYMELIGEISPVEMDEASGGTVMYSSLTGSKVSSAQELSAEYWVNNMQNPVKFLQGLLALLKHKKVASGSSRAVAVQWGGFLEIGPHSALQGPVKQIIDKSNNKFAKSAPYTSMLIRGKNAEETAMSAAGTLWAAGYKIDISSVNQQSVAADAPQMLCDMPAYPWNHARGFWHESYSARSYRFPPHARSDYLGMAEDSQNNHEPRWRNYLRVSENPWIEDHVITGTVLYPGAGMLVMAVEGALRAADSSKPIEGFRLTDVMFERGLVVSVDDDTPVETRISFQPNSTKNSSWDFAVYSMTNSSPWAKHCAGTVTAVYEAAESQVEENRADVQWQSQIDFGTALFSREDATSVKVDEFYKNLEEIGMQYGATFRNVKSLTAVPSQNASYGTVAVPDTKSTMPKNYESSHVIHPATMDSIFHLVLASLNTGRPVEQAAVPYSIEEIYVAREQPKEAGDLYSGYGRLLSQHGHEIMTDLVVSDQTWSKAKLTVKNFALRQVTSNTGSDGVSSSTGPAKNCVGITWVPDLSFLRQNEDISKIIKPGKTIPMVQAWLDSVFLKTSDSTALVIMFDESQSSIDVLKHLKTRAYGAKNIIAYASSEDRLHLMQKTLGDGTDDSTITYSWLPEEELLNTLAPESNDLVIALGVPQIETNAESLTKLAPLSCFVQHGHSEAPRVTIPHTKCHGVVSDDGAYALFASGMTTTGTVTGQPVYLLMPSGPSQSTLALASEIERKLEQSQSSCIRVTLTSTDLAILKEKSVISLLEVDTPLVYSWSEDEFSCFKLLVSTVAHLFWITRGSVLESWSNGVEFATSQGLFRVMRNEYPIATLPSLDLSAVADVSNSACADLILNVWKASFADGAEMEYAENNGLIYIPRATEDAGFDRELQLAKNTAAPVLSSLGSSKSPLKALLSSVSPGYMWIPDEEAELPLATGEVEVKIEYAGLTAEGGLNSLRHAVGVVSRCNSTATTFELGKRVIVLCEMTGKTHVRQNEALVAALPDHLQPGEAVTLVEPLITAHYTLFEMARLTRGQTLLLDDAASPLGRAMIQAAQSVGAKVFALVSSRAEKDILINNISFAHTEIFDVSLRNFVPVIQASTCHRGVDVVVNQLHGSHVEDSISVLGSFGRFFEMKNERPASNLLKIKANASMFRIDMDAVIKERPQVIKSIFEQYLNKFQFSGKSSFEVTSVTDVSASTKVARSKQTVLSFADTDLVPMPAPPPEKLQLDSDAAYVLVGGLGALGLDIANWMVDCGAKHLVFLSRSGGEKNEEDLQRFADRSVKAEAFKCNVNDLLNVSKVFDAIKAEGKRIAGVIQLAMVLEDGIFDNMSFTQWSRAIEPKTKGSRNLLANIWPGDKPFFILLSSITGVIGNTAQANYASGNTFEDALAHHARHHLGINATSIDVGLVSDSSHFTASGEFGDLDSYLGRYQHGWRGLQTNLDELGVAMRAVMRGHTAAGQELPAQVVLGLGNRIEHKEGSDGYTKDMKFCLRVVKAATTDGEGAKQDIALLLSNATTAAEAAAMVEENIKELVAAAMGVSLEEVDSQKPLYDYGVDSLQAVEIRNRALKNMKSDISVFDILSAMPLAEVAAKIASKSQLVKVTNGED
ncbi:hypothetical protein NLG97_g515 [Lecanicillium saksenae]|uniref:Uncharacterized protein n=1 Tax=Lecanicillium saksenae TaxID=468837 RepID=A0ACC1R890_9HYPO|nr:hypothetical protein NLG97_g515 [Lecanicillium saksenae]